MPEGPELHLASRFINHFCKGRLFGKVLKSEISKNPVIIPPADCYTISSSSRGKEIKITLTESTKHVNGGTKSCITKAKSLDILFTFGLAGKFDFHEASELQKHAHLNFFTCDTQPSSVLSFVDYMRFGKWTPGADFSLKDRGPCVLFDYSNFRNNVLQNLEATAFNKPICEVLLNQKYFNGIGNYLRAEILHRVKIPPFVSARSVLEPLTAGDEGSAVVKEENPDILQLCHILPQEVLSLESSWYDGKDRSDESNLFNAWLQCYYQDGMNNIADHNKRTIWYSGPLGPLAPKDGKVRARKSPKKKKKSSDSETGKDEVNKKSPTKRRRKTAVEDTATDEINPPENKKAKRAKSVKSAVLKKEKLENDDNTEDVNGIVEGKQKSKSKKAKSGKLKGSVSTDLDKLSEDVKNSLQKGRITRGKIKQIVEVIDHASEKKNGPKKRRVVKSEKVTIKSELESSFEDSGKSDMKLNGYSDVLKNNGELPVNGVIKIEQNVGEATGADGKLVLSARTKLKARVGRTGKNVGDDSHRGRNSQREKLKTPRKKSIKRLSK